MGQAAPPGFRILEKLSEGGMGEVFLAQREGAAGLVVIKTLLPELCSNAALFERFLREAEIASRLAHPNIARLERADMSDGKLFLAFEFVPGVDFFELFLAANARNERIPARVLLSLGVQLLDALAYAHELADDDGVYLGLVHRDLAPQNLMVTFDGAAKIIDFGLSHAALGDFRTESGMVIGTLRYTSPEQARGEPVDARSDLYTLSLVLLEGLIGEAVVPEKHNGEIWSLIENEPAPRLSDRRPDLPAALSTFFERALAKDRDARFPSAASMRSALMDAAPDLVNADDEEIAEEVRDLVPEAYEKTLQLFERFEDLSVDGSAAPALEATTTLPDASPAADAQEGERDRPRTKAERPRVRDVEIGASGARSAARGAEMGGRASPGRDPKTSALLVSSRMIEPLSGTKNERRAANAEGGPPAPTPPAPPAAEPSPERASSVGDVRPQTEPIARTPPPRARRSRRPVLTAALVVLGLLTCFAIGTGAYYATGYFVAASQRATE